jgi:hypothetical protein
MKIDFPKHKKFRGTDVLRQKQGLAYAYMTEHKSVDADGAPNAYHPDDKGKHCIKQPHKGLDCLAHAGYPNTGWWDSVLIPDPGNPTTPYRQKLGPYAGYFLAMTSLRAKKGDKYSTAYYVDSREFPYVVIPTGFTKPNGLGFWGQGDVGLATHVDTEKSVPFIVADYGGGGTAKLGEGSIALFEALGGNNPNPRTGAGVPKGKIQYIVFPNSRLKGDAIWPRTKSDIRKQVMDLISSTPDIDKG